LRPSLESTLSNSVATMLTPGSTDRRL